MVERVLFMASEACSAVSEVAHPAFLVHVAGRDAIGRVIADSRAVLRGGHRGGHAARERRATHYEKCSKHVDVLPWLRPQRLMPGPVRQASAGGGIGWLTDRLRIA